MNPLDKLFLGGTAVEGGLDMNKALKGEDNPYDKILGNKIVKTTAKNGQMNALNSNNPMYANASEVVDIMYDIEKEAGVKKILDVAKKVVGEKGKKIADAINKADSGMQGHLSEMKIERTLMKDNKDFKGLKALKDKSYRDHVKGAAKVIIPAGAVGVAGTAGAIEGVKKVEDKFNNGGNRKGSNPIQDAGDSMYPYVAGAGLLGAATFDALAHKSVVAPFKHMGQGVQKGLYKYPKKILGKAGKSGKAAVEVLKAATKDIKPKEVKASEDIDMLIEKQAGSERILKGKELAKQLLVKDFFQEGVKSIPYVGVPATASYLVGRDLRHGGRKIKDTYDDQIVIDVPLKNMPAKNVSEKIAGDGIPSMEKFLKNGIPERAVQGLSRAFFPTVIVATTGRNMTNAMEDIRKKQDKLPPVEEGKARVIIQLAPKKASEEIDDLSFDKKASEDIDDLYFENEVIKW